jgi:hypothetical protein
MCQLIEGTPLFELRKGIVHITDRSGERAMSLGDFVDASRLASRLARQWVAEANQGSRVRDFKQVEVAE